MNPLVLKPSGTAAAQKQALIMCIVTYSSSHFTIRSIVGGKKKNLVLLFHLADDRGKMAKYIVEA